LKGQTGTNHQYIDCQFKMLMIWSGWIS